MYVSFLWCFAVPVGPEIKFALYLHVFLLHTRNDNIDFQSSISCMFHFSTIISSEMDIHKTTSRYILDLRKKLSKSCMFMLHFVYAHFARNLRPKVLHTRNT